MNTYENPTVAAWAQKQIRMRVAKARRGKLHISEIISTCLRKSYLNRTDPQPLDSESELRFAVGFAVQEYFLGPEAEGQTFDDVVYSVDARLKDDVLEFKTTRRYYETKAKGKFEPNSEWIDRTRAYCLVHKVKRAHIIVHHLLQDKLSAWTIELTDDDLKETASIIKTRQAILTDALANSNPPPVTTRWADYECERCPHRLKHCEKELMELAI